MTKKFTKPQDLGLTRELVALAWGKVYLQGFKEESRDYHSEFAEALGCTRQEAKELCYWFIYTTPFLMSLDCLSRVSALESARGTMLSSAGVNAGVDSLTRHMERLDVKREANQKGLRA